MVGVFTCGLPAFLRKVIGFCISFLMIASQCILIDEYQVTIVFYNSDHTFYGLEIRSVELGNTYFPHIMSQLSYPNACIHDALFGCQK